MHDLVIIGCGPAGLSAALTAERKGLDYLVLERGLVANTIHRFPVARKLFSTGNELELKAGWFTKGAKPTREELLFHYLKTARDEDLNIVDGTEVLGLSRTADGFEVRTREREFQSVAVILAMGGFGKHRRLSVPGENDRRVSYSFKDPYRFGLKRVLVVGGGNSAAEAALDLSELATAVTLSLRRAALELPPTSPGAAAIKPWVLAPLVAAIQEGRISLACSSRVLEITTQSAILAIRPAAISNDEPGMRGPVGVVEEIPCDHILALIGADPDTTLLAEAGAEIAEDGRPVYDTETYETTVPGLFVAGHLTRERHIKNAIETGRRVVETSVAAALERCSA